MSKFGLHQRAKNFGNAFHTHTKRGLALADRGLGHLHTAVKAIPEPLVEQLAGPEAGSALRYAKQGLGAYETVRHVATGQPR